LRRDHDALIGPAPVRAEVPAPSTAPPASSSLSRTLIQPLSPSRYKVQFTASAQLRDKLERLQALLRSSVPDGDLATIVEQAVTEKLERLEARRFAKTKSPRKVLPQVGARSTEKGTRPRSRYIPAVVRRTVEERDGGRCTYRDAQGRRCTRRNDLEYHHRTPFGRGGQHSVDVLTLMCQTHNMLMAERDYGKEVMARFRHRARRSTDASRHG